jgi:c-di-GMP-binding flagellar brake protein YcgR
MSNSLEKLKGITIDGITYDLDDSYADKRVEEDIDDLKSRVTDIENAPPSTCLPEISENDNNKFLRVQNGQAAWVTIQAAEGIKF